MIRRIPITELTVDQRSEVERLMLEGRPVDAVVYIRKNIDCGLAEANNLRKDVMKAAARRRA